jgi:hypothetical protein
LLKYYVQLLLIFIIIFINILTNVYVLTFYVHYYNISCVDWKIVNNINWKKNTTWRININYYLYRATFKFLRSTCTYGFNWNLNPLKVYVAKYSVFIAFFKLETRNKNSIIENELIYLYTKFHNNQSLYTHINFSFIFSYFDFFSMFLWIFNRNFALY